MIVTTWTYRSSRRRCSVEKVVLKNFALFTRKHLCWNHFLIRLSAFRPATLWKRDSNLNITNVLRTPILKNICERLLLNVMLIVQYSYYHLVTSKHLVTDKVSYRKIVGRYRMESSKRSFCFTVTFIQQVKQIGKS